MFYDICIKNIIFDPFATDHLLSILSHLERRLSQLQGLDHHLHFSLSKNLLCQIQNNYSTKYFHNLFSLSIDHNSVKINYYPY